MAALLRSPALAVAALFTLASAASAETATWTKYGSFTPPGYRDAHVIVFDPPRRRIIMYGGPNPNDVCVLGADGAPPWALMSITGTLPPGRSLTSAAYDPLLQRIIVFGGASHETGNPGLNDVWSLNIAYFPTTWTQLVTTGTPPTPRRNAAMVLDPVRNRIVVFGGQDDFAYRNDVHALDLSTLVWTNLPEAGPWPSARGGAAVARDPVNDRMIIFGGRHDTGFLNDTWALPLSLAGPWYSPGGAIYKPRERAYATMIYSSASQRVMIYGGLSPVDVSGYRPDLWALPMNGTQYWSEILPATTAPSGRYFHAAAYDPVRDRMWVHGGRAGGSAQASSAAGQETWSVQFQDYATAVQLSTATVDARSDQVRIEWRSEGEMRPVFVAERRVPDGAWTTLAELTPGEGGRVVLVDAGVAPGMTYEYRLSWPSELGLSHGGDVRVTVPTGVGFALDGASPNPSPGDLTIAFGLPDDAPARLEVFDLGGRRVAHHEVGALGSGSHRIRVTDGIELAAGIYVIRLAHGTEVKTKRVAILR